ncbi:hypothetical protein CROQUDRAFT_668980 [Cronartium quercuum f. sp. fusiforme G11]|uniref:AB hydrolase-1 domain-containing protein n=1 Tax=Cronartium quercuum f. sp. fusiforme G11 TaxID=708437 RepID=A0A9P6TGK8_9BASI|nr:hypothetical protein CROQUDRAFT_668980 [Cronartium quercuum f. sp. fusiforme G11]
MATSDRGPVEIRKFKLEAPFHTQNGGIIPDGWLAYKVFGSKSQSEKLALGSLKLTDKPVILYPTWFSGLIEDNEWLIGEGMALDPEYFDIIIVAMLGNGQSSSPSNTPEPWNGPRFPRITVHDQVRAQYQLCTHLGVTKIHTVIGWSMGAGQSYQWAVSYPDMVQRCIPFCGSAKTSDHNITFLRSLESALQLDPVFNRGWYSTPPQEGLRAFARIYSAWGFSQSFYREKLYVKMGFPTLDSFLVGFWEDLFLKKDANNLLSMLFTWIHGDISASPTFEGDYEKALKSIKAKTLIMPSATDLYFPPEDNQLEGNHIMNCEVKVIPSIWGHFAGG